MMHIEKRDSKIECVDAAVATLAQMLREYKGEVLLFASGGSSLEVLAKSDPQLFSSRITLMPLDERFSVVESENNSLQIAALDSVAAGIARGMHFVPMVPQSEETLTQFVDRFDAGIRVWQQTHPDGSMIATCGIGPDAHTFGIMPYPEDQEGFDQRFVSTDRLVVGYDATGKNQYPLRATTTVPLARLLAASVWVACGTSKQDALTRTLETDASIHEAPARIIHAMRNVTLFTDLHISR